MEPQMSNKQKLTTEHFIFVFILNLHNEGRERKNETGAGVAQARPVTAVIFRVYAIVERLLH